MTFFSVAVEVHAVHQNNKYEKDEDAYEAEDGFLVLAHSFAVNENGAGDLDVLQEGLAQVQEVGSSASLSPMSLREMGFINDQNFITYKGSKTVPPCTESVNWLYYVHTGTVSESMVKN